MIDAFDLYEQLIGKVNTHQGGHVRPHRNFLQWVNDIRLEIFNNLYKEWETNQADTDLLTPFLKSTNVIVKGVSRQMWDEVALPKDYAYFSSLRIWKDGKTSVGCKTCTTIDGTTGEEVGSLNHKMINEDEILRAREEADAKLQEITVDKVDNARWGSICAHRTMSPQRTGIPKCTQFDRGLKVAPKGTGILILDYFRLPVPATFKYTILNPGTESEYIQYVKSGSQPLEFSETLIPEFLQRLQKRYGTFVRDPSLYEQGERDRATQP